MKNLLVCQIKFMLKTIVNTSKKLKYINHDVYYHFEKDTVVTDSVISLAEHEANKLGKLSEFMYLYKEVLTQTSSKNIKFGHLVWIFDTLLKLSDKPIGNDVIVPEFGDYEFIA